MGSVADLYVSGDNDPEIEPEQYYRHYLYCDACGSFELGGWLLPENHEGIERTRQRLWRAAVIALVVVAASGWMTLDLFPAPAFVLYLAAVVVIAPVLYGLGDQLGAQNAATRWRLSKAILLWLPLVALTGFLADEIPSPSWLLLAGLIVLVCLLVARAVLGSNIELAGMRCRQCGATYANGTAFFTELEANPRNLTIDAVPRPLGSSPFSRGKSVAYEPPNPKSRLSA